MGKAVGDYLGVDLGEAFDGGVAVEQERGEGVLECSAGCWNGGKGSFN